jgi:hypothetical protein
MGDRKIKTLSPRTGRGLFSAWSRFSMGDFDDSFAAWRDVVIRDNAWQQINGTVGLGLATGGGLGTGPVWAIYYYNAIDTASSFATPTTVLIAHVGGTISPTGGTAVLGRYDTNAVILSTTRPHELNFLTIKNRLFIAGATLTGGAKPTIVTKYPSATQYDWGIPAPTAQLGHTPYTGLLGGYNPSVSIFYNDGTTGDGIETDGGATINIGSPSLVDTPPGSFDASGAWDGKTIIINATPTTQTFKINTITDSENGTLTTNSFAPAQGPDAIYEVHYGNLTWTTGPPKYAYSYYNPTTGHSSSISPVHSLSEQNMTDVSVEITDIPVTNDPNYTHVILWRTPTDGAVLQPLKLDRVFNTAAGGTATVENTVGSPAEFLIVNNGPGTVTYVDNQPNSELSRVIGVFDAPTTNGPPPEDIKFMEYWDGRVFCNTVSEPWRIRFSRQTNSAELGIGEESFPEVNYFDIPANDGVCTGMKAVGSGLLFCTDRYLYSCSPNYQTGQTPPDRISSRASGVTHWAIDEHPGDTTTNTASAIYIGRDKRLWRQYPGGRLDDIGAPIQDRLNRGNLTISKPYIVRVFSRGKSWFCAVGIGRAEGRYDFYFFDLDSLCWVDFGFSGGVIKGLSIGSGIEFASGAGETFAHIGSVTSQQVYPVLDTSIAISTASLLTTQVMDMGDPTSLKTLEEIVFYLDDTSPAGWNCAVRFDGSTAGYVSLGEATFTGSPRYRGPGILRFNPKDLASRFWHAIQLEMTLATGSAMVAGALYRAEIVYKVESTGVSARPSG